MSQQDAPELFRYFVEALAEGELKIFKQEHGEETPEQKTPYKKIQTHTQKTFCGYLVNHVYCLHCHHKSWTFDIYSDLMVNIDSAEKAKKEGGSTFGLFQFGREKFADEKRWAQGEFIKIE